MGDIVIACMAVFPCAKELDHARTACSPPPFDTPQLSRCGSTPPPLPPPAVFAFCVGGPPAAGGAGPPDKSGGAPRFAVHPPYRGALASALSCAGPQWPARCAAP